MRLNFKYDTYQDVRKNLFQYTLPFLIAAGFFCYFFILPETNQQNAVKLLEKVSESQLVKDILGTGVGLGLFTTLAYFLTEILKVHDKWYDRYIIRWRHRYDTEFILPKLVQPFANFLNYRFYESAKNSTKKFQEQLFYPFVGDSDFKIPKNKLVRFYEVITVYWLTQINEILLLILVSLVFIYRFAGPADVVYRTMLLNVCLGLNICFLLNRYWRRCSLRNVKIATEDEIQAIHDDQNLLPDLKKRLIKLCADYSIPYREGNQNQNTA